jgi:hypothetical protein
MGDNFKIGGRLVAGPDQSALYPIAAPRTPVAAPSTPVAAPSTPIEVRLTRAGRRWDRVERTSIGRNRGGAGGIGAERGSRRSGRDRDRI